LGVAGDFSYNVVPIEVLNFIANNPEVLGDRLHAVQFGDNVDRQFPFMYGEDNRVFVVSSSDVEKGKVEFQLRGDPDAGPVTIRLDREKLLRDFLRTATAGLVVTRPAIVRGLAAPAAPELAGLGITPIRGPSYGQIARPYVRAMLRTERPVEMHYAPELAQEGLDESNETFAEKAQAAGVNIVVDHQIGSIQNPEASQVYIVSAERLQQQAYGEILNGATVIAIETQKDVPQFFNNTVINMLASALASFEIKTTRDAMRFNDRFSTLQRSALGGVTFKIKDVQVVRNFPGDTPSIRIVVSYNIPRNLTKAQAIEQVQLALDAVDYAA